MDLLASSKRVCCPNDRVRKVIHDDKELEKYWMPWFFRENRERFRDFIGHATYLWKDEKGKEMV